jgi:hypothetical protein
MSCQWLQIARVDEELDHYKALENTWAATKSSLAEEISDLTSQARMSRLVPENKIKMLFFIRGGGG